MRLFTVCLLMIAVTTARADDPFELTSKDGRFAAAFPADPVKSLSKVELKAGAGEITITQFAAEHKKNGYTIAFNDYPRGSLAPKAQDVLKGVRDGNIGDGTLGDEKSGTFGPRKLPMRAFTFSRDKFHYRNLIILDDHRLYQVMIVAEAEAALSDETAEAFFKAFQITGAPPPPAIVKGKDGFTSKDGRYSVAFPDTPKEQKTMVPLAGTDKKITVINQVVEIDKSTAFLVGYNDYPAGVISPDPQDVLQGVRDGNIGPDGKLIDEKKTTFGPRKLPMREITFTKNNIQFRNRIILDGTRLYQVMIVAEDEKMLANDRAKKFFDSFKILPMDD